MEKMTKKNIYTALVNYAETGVMSFETEDAEIVVDAEALRAFAENEIALLDKKAAKAKESAARKRAEVSPLYLAIQDALSDEYEPIAEIAARVEGEDVTAAKVTAQLTKLVKAGIAEKDDIKVPGGEGKKTRTVKGYRRIVAE